MNPLTKTFSAGSHLFHENDRSRELYIIQSGTVKVYRTQSGREVELAIMGKGSVLGEMALIDGRPRSASAKALDECSATIIDADVFYKRVKGVPGWFMSICKMTCQKLRNANRLLQSMGGGRHGINIILALGYEFARTGDRLDGPAARRRLAKLLGASESSIVRVCGFLDSNGLIQYSDTEIRLPDKKRLNEYCDFLRLFIQKVYERAAAPSDNVRSAVQALADRYPDLLAGAESPAAVTDIDGDELWLLFKERGFDQNFQDIIPFFESSGLLKVIKKEGGSAETAGEANPMAHSKVQVNHGQLKQWYLYQKFNGMIPIL